MSVTASVISISGALTRPARSRRHSIQSHRKSSLTAICSGSTSLHVRLELIYHREQLLWISSLNLPAKISLPFSFPPYIWLSAVLVRIHSTRYQRTATDISGVVRTTAFLHAAALSLSLPLSDGP